MWVYSPSKPKPAKVSTELEKSISEQADEIVETILKPKWIKEVAEDYQFNYLVDIFTKWLRNRFYFYSKYRCPDPRAISPSFEMRFARMTHIGGGKFNLAYFRHTGKWNEVYEDLTAEECFEEIKNGGLFQP